MTTSAKAWSVTGYTLDGRAYCPACMDIHFNTQQEGEWVEKLLKFTENLSPVFASDEHNLTCDRCDTQLGK